MKLGKTVPVLTVISLMLLVASACGGEKNPFSVRSEVVAPADHASALAFAPDGRLFFAEQFTGSIRIIGADDRPAEKPFAELEVARWVEWGITGLTLDPDFSANHFVYVFYTRPVSKEQPPVAKPVLIRLTERDGEGVDPKVIIGDLPETALNKQGFSANGRIHFGPDGFLYVSVGDYDESPSKARDLKTPVGKVLRVKKEDGSPAPGNPFINDSRADPRVFAYGFRKQADFAFGPNGGLYATDYTSAPTCEELNMVRAGADFGWPDVGAFPFSDCAFGDQVKAVHLLAKNGANPSDFQSPLAVTGMAFVKSGKYPSLGDSLLVCGSVTGEIRRIVLTGERFDQVNGDDDVVVKDCRDKNSREPGFMPDVETSPGDIVYYTTDKEIRRLAPK